MIVLDASAAIDFMVLVAIPGFGHRPRFNETCGRLPASRFL